jgi:serine protease AprX
VHGSTERVRELVARHGGRVSRWLQDGAAITVPDTAIGALVDEPGLDHLSGDVPVGPAMTVTNKATAADQARQGSSGLLGLLSSPSLTGKGIGIAVIDSGIATHTALGSRVVARVSFAGSGKDPFGHGTHVAGGAAGASTTVTSLYRGGIAPGAHLIDVRVLGPDGLGYTSDVIAGIDWAIANRSRYNIRVINLSIGRPVTEPAATDPLCEAVERAVRAGIVVVAAAGNYGRLPDGRMVLGGITSPGNSPHAITVGALNTWGTVERTDDTVTTYSSRGPTRYDFAMKPDIVAPGNRIVSLEAAGSYLATSGIAPHVAGSGTNAYMILSGTSMATSVVSGGVALLLQANPGLSPAQVKMALQAGASHMPEAGLVAAGAGSVNFDASRTIASSGLTATLTTVIGGVLSPSGGAFYWDTGTLNERLYAGPGLRLWSLLELPFVWGNPSRAEWGTLNLAGLLNPIALLTPKRTIWGDMEGWTSSNYIVWGTSMQNPEDGEYIVWGTSGADDEYIVWGTSGAAEDGGAPAYRPVTADPFRRR